VKLQAIPQPARSRVDIVPVTTIINASTNEQVGHIIQFALDNPKKNQLPQLPAGFIYPAATKL